MNRTVEHLQEMLHNWTREAGYKLFVCMLGRELDKYYTKETVALQCVESISLHDYDCIIEPSAGSGNFLKHLTGNVVGLDICPEGAGIIKQDWTSYRISTQYSRVLVIGNPPFGVNHAKSDMFIRHALSFENVQTIAFILPNTYNKHTRQRILPSNWRIKEVHPIERDAFLFDNQTRHVPCSFFIFDKSEGEDLRVNPNRYTETKHFTFGNRTVFDLFVFGAAPKRVTYNPKPNNRGYFLRAKEGFRKEFIADNIRSIDWRGNSCANGGVFWLTKYEFLSQYIAQCQ